MLGLTQESATDVLAGLLYALGFRPQESVVVGILSGGRVQGVGRFDLADVLASPREVAPVLARAAERVGSASVVVAIVTADPTVASTELGGELARDLEATGLPCLDVFTVTGTTFRARNVGPLPLDELRSTRAAAHAVSAGRAMLPSRADLLADVEPDEQGAPLAPAPGRVDASQVLRTWTADLAGTGQEPTEAASLLAALARPALRDAVILTILDPRETDPHRLQAMTEDDVFRLAARVPVIDHVARATALLASIARRAAHPADVLAVLAWTAWWSGEGARADQVAARALATSPHHRLAMLTARLVEAQVPPPWRM